MKKALLIVYGVIFLALILLSIFGMMSLGEFSLPTLVSTAFSAIYLTGLWGYTFGKKIWTAVIWRRFFYLLCFGTIVTFLIGTLAVGGQQAIEAIIGLVISIPLVYCLYQYSKGEQSYWLNTEENLKGRILNDLMANNKSELELEKEHGSSKALIKVSMEDDEYVVRITRLNGDSEDSFKNTFANLGHLAIFIEQYTFIKISDFERKYA
ncbi:hypothetical protein [Pseudoalteromonas ruthenica]|uniref:hypothetical protein n=1 Tax=Pseudoalteromonas ruthenica TaxID=151081 RepID=UPI00110BEED3|nr:hypothetical protein [Pseudoalteromonas ruthenica]TMO49875.1 hypothetical protein CWC24_00185 [Pseudoalteromonas ruthenica]TMO50553.1 hypothetical protein CWC23_10665 [Pseudoalteromonas ruthenica]